MGEIRRLLASGQLDDAKSPMYTVPLGKRARIGLVNTSNGSDSLGYTFDLFVTPIGGDSVRISGKATALAASKSAEFPEDGKSIELSAGDSIDGLGSVADVIDYTIWGVELTL